MQIINAYFHSFVLKLSVSTHHQVPRFYNVFLKPLWSVQAGKWVGAMVNLSMLTNARMMADDCPTGLWQAVYY